MSNIENKPFATVSNIAYQLGVAQTTVQTVIDLHRLSPGGKLEVKNYDDYDYPYTTDHLTYNIEEVKKALAVARKSFELIYQRSNFVGQRFNLDTTPKKEEPTINFDNLVGTGRPIVNSIINYWIKYHSKPNPNLTIGGKNIEWPQWTSGAVFKTKEEKMPEMMSVVKSSLQFWFPEGSQVHGHEGEVWRLHNLKAGLVDLLSTGSKVVTFSAELVDKLRELAHSDKLVFNEFEKVHTDSKEIYDITTLSKLISDEGQITTTWKVYIWGRWGVSGVSHTCTISLTYPSK